MSGVTLSVLIEAALRGQPYNQLRLGLAAQRYARKITNRLCPDFPEDRHEEVFQQAFVELFTFGASALPAGGGQALFRRAVLNATRVVRSNYTPPGQRTRQPVKGAPLGPDRVAAEDIGRVADAETVDRCTVGDGLTASVDFDLFESPDAEQAVLDVETRIDLNDALSRAPLVIAAALRLICINGETVVAAARQVEVDRYTLTRRLDAFCPTWRAAA